MSRATAESASIAIRVQKKDAESVLKRAIAMGALDRDRKVLDRDGYVEIPLRSPLPGYDPFPQVAPRFYRRQPDLAEALGEELPGEAVRLLPRSWYILGGVIIVKIHPDLTPFQSQIGQALLSCYPRCHSVLRDFGIVGPLREPVREVIAGGRTETIHRENGVLFKLDAKRVMFSAGNLGERIRMAHLGRDEVVVDMFAGIGYFSLPMAVHSRPRRVFAIELNPVAYSYLCENIALNRVGEIVHPILGDCSEKAPEGIADRVVMGMVQFTDRYLRRGILALRSGGVLHYHQTVPSWRYPADAVRDVKEAAEALGLEACILGCTRVKKYSPGVVHAVVDARIWSDPCRKERMRRSTLADR